MTRPAGGRSRSSAGFWLLLAGLVVAIAGFTALGVWQVERRTWKLALIKRLDQRVHAAPVAAPGPAEWPSITDASSAYRRVRAAGVFLNDRATRVQAVTALGGGYWLLTPLVTRQGFTVLVNRGFVPPDWHVPAASAGTEAQVTGLLRITEPGGAFLHHNDPGDDRWYSRDVAAIARARGVSDAAPYFIDQDRVPGDADGPVGGLTVIDLPNSHLVYALTWFGLAALAVAGTVYLVIDRYGPARRRAGGAAA